MSASEKLRSELYTRAGGTCECTMQKCDHAGKRCTRSLRSPGWDAHRRSAGGEYSLSNCLAYCATCHKATLSYGG